MVFVLTSEPTFKRFGIRYAVTGRAISWFLIIFVLSISTYALFNRSIDSVLDNFRRPEFSHGYIILLVGAWIIWQRRLLIWSRRNAGDRSGYILIAFGVLTALFCHAANIVTPPYVSFLITVIGAAAVVLGWRSARLLLAPIGLLFLAYPLPDNLYIELSTRLQWLSSQLGAIILDALRVPVYVDGNIIDLGVMRLQVAEACSGLRYLFPLITFGLICAFIYRAPFWAKALVVAATIPIAILLNGARIAATGLFVHFGTLHLAEGFMHLFEGWVIFLIALAALFALMYVLSRLTGNARVFLDILDFDRVAGVPEGQRAAPNAVTSSAPPAQDALPRSQVAAIATVMTIAALVLVPISLRPQVIPERPGLITYPLQVDQWRGAPSVVEPHIVDLLGADDYLLVDFDAGDEPAVNLWAAYYNSLLGGSYIHSPTTCLPGAGWEYVELGQFSTQLVNFRGKVLQVNRGIVVKGEQRVLMYFWVELRGRSVQSLQKVKFFNLWDSFAIGRSDGALVRVLTALQAGEDAVDGDRRLHAFLERAYPALEVHLGG